ncbi:MAG: sulfate ABC transporter permease subunit [Tomitella sp.]|nr:sulfate ABC transporter permease subunit [Tomitella sp.]
MRSSLVGRLALRFGALAYVAVLLLVPVGLILWRTFEHGLGTFWDWISTPAAVSALNVSLLIVAIVVPLNAVFGVGIAIALARGRFRGRRLLQALVDLPFGVSGVVVGSALMLLWGSGGWFGFLHDWGFQVIFALPGMVLAMWFVTLPFVVREVEPVLAEIGEEQEQAAATLGSGRWQTFRRITLPGIRWGLTYGIVLTVARSLGEFGAVIMVSSGLAGHTQTLTLLVEARHQAGNEYGAYAAATLLMMVAVATLGLMSLFNRKRKAGR